MTDALAGLAAGFALIVAIGAQNAFVLRQGVRRDHVGLVVVLCTLSDLVLITAGTAGIGALLTGRPWLLEVFRWGGAAYLLWFAWTSLRAALKPSGLVAAEPTRSSGSIATTTLALTWLNPHVYLDTVILLGSLANQHASRWSFACGAMLASVIWFTALGFGARLLAKPLAKPAVWRWLDGIIGVAMVGFALRLVWG